MAADTWKNGGVDLRHDTATNWVGGVEPGAGDTATYDDDGISPPDANTGQAAGINLVFDGSFDDTFSTDILTDNATHTAGTIVLAAGTTATVKGTTHSGITAGAGSTVSIDGTATGDVTFSTTGELDGVNTPLVEGDVIFGGAGTVNWDNGLSISGSFDAQGQTISHNSTSGATGTLTLETDDGARDFDLGTSADIGDVAVVVNSGASTFTCVQDSTYGAFTLSGGTYAPVATAQNPSGNLDLSGGTLTTGTAVWTHQGTSNLVGKALANNMASYVVGAASTITMTGDMTGKKITIPSGATLNMTGGTLYNYLGTGNDQFDIQGTLSGNRDIIWFPNANTNQKALAIVSTGKFWLRTVASQTVTMTGDLTLAGALEIASNAVDNTGTIDMNNHRLSVAGITTIGRSNAATRCGQLKLGGASHSMAGLIGGNAANLSNVFDSGSAYVEIANGSTWDGTDIATLANVGAHLMCMGAVSVTDFDGSDPGEKLHFHSAPGAITSVQNNDYADFDEHAAPGSMATMGVGV